MQSHMCTAVSKILRQPCIFHSTAHVNRNTISRAQLFRPHMNENNSTKVNTIHMKAKWFHFQPRIPY